MAGGDADANAAGKRPHGKAQRRDGLEPRVEIRLNAVRGQHAGGLPGKALAADAAVIADGSAPGKTGSVQNVRRGLRGAADDVDVHAVRARAENAAQAAGAELQLAAKGVFDLLRAVGHFQQFFFQIGVQQRLRQPFGKTGAGKVHGIASILCIVSR